MPDKKLVVIGDGEEFDKIKDIAQDNIQLLGYQDKECMIDYMQRARAFVYVAVEDFGIVSIEALACGTPVIALNDGGTAEIIKHKINGIHFKEQKKEDIIDGVTEFELTEFKPQKISDHAQVFCTSRFKKEIEEFIEYNVSHESK